jgi:predicted amidohydrolase
MVSLAAAQLEPRPGRLGEAVEAHVRFARAAAELGAQLLVFPEFSLTGYDRALTREHALRVTDSWLDPLAEVSWKLGITLVIGAPIAGTDRLMIASFCFRPDGRVLTYTKRHLHHGEERTFEPGDGGALLDVDGTHVGLAICAEINHASHVADAVAHGAAVYAASCFLTPAGYSADCRTLQGYAAFARRRCRDGELHGRVRRIRVGGRVRSGTIREDWPRALGESICWWRLAKTMDGWGGA